VAETQRDLRCENLGKERVSQQFIVVGRENICVYVRASDPARVRMISNFLAITVSVVLVLGSPKFFLLFLNVLLYASIILICFKLILIFYT
jgi:hypothetical protein